ncbi:hypothetical protein HPB47_000562 [Ixodes persulcatus]|uniref:Uncharacterized protein n=1 Tax=Ixodes persulcatus TaxID=34615 RepID=A0AC60PRP0_IXOPE|nr:hypothetical protein HPB47_000562 [Ixodes persulcatus]
MQSSLLRVWLLRSPPVLGHEVQEVGNTVLFLEVLELCARIDRVLSCPRGSLLLAGVAGMGRRMAASVVAHMHGVATFTPKMTLNYATRNLMADLKAIVQASGIENQQMLLLLEDHQLSDPESLEIVNGLLATGEVPGLFRQEELEPLLAPLRDQAAEEGYRGSALSYFCHRARLRQVGDSPEQIVTRFRSVETLKKVAEGSILNSPSGARETSNGRWYNRWPEERHLDNHLQLKDRLLLKSRRHLQRRNGLHLGATNPTWIPHLYKELAATGVALTRSASTPRESDAPGRAAPNELGRAVRCSPPYIRSARIMTTKQRQALPLSDKVDIIRRVERGEKKSDVAAAFKIARSSLSTILKNKSTIKNQARERPNADSKRIRNRPTTRDFAFVLEVEGVTGGTGWLQQFKDRYSIVGKVVAGERSQADVIDLCAGQMTAAAPRTRRTCAAAAKAAVRRRRGFTAPATQGGGALAYHVTSGGSGGRQLQIRIVP